MDLSDEELRFRRTRLVDSRQDAFGNTLGAERNRRSNEHSASRNVDAASRPRQTKRVDSYRTLEYPAPRFGRGLCPLKASKAHLEDLEVRKE